MTNGTTMKLKDAVLVTAPDGSAVRILPATERGSMAHFSLQPGEVSQAVVHRSVEEIWYVTAGGGRIWRSSGGEESVTELEPGLSLTIPVGTSFQFRAADDQALEVVAVTMPPWPGADEALPQSGPWPATLV
ncbi:MAG: cupin domain-containing protein [Geminicoccaceae bacterium]